MKIRLLIITTLLIAYSHMNYAATIYVTETGAGSMNGTSWANAYPGASLQTVINGANPGDQVWVAAGIYFTTTNTDRTISFSMRNNVEIYGSFTGTETTLGQRDISCGPNSILSGNIGLATTTDNSYQVIRNTNIDTSAQLDGFVITGGYDERPATLTTGLGGGILNIGSNSNYCFPMIRNCVITYNQAEFGAGIFNDGYNNGNVICYIENSVIVNNYATGGGGGVDNFGLSGSAQTHMFNCLIANNIADDAAGAMYCWGGSNGFASGYLAHCTVVNNTVTAGVGGGFVVDRSNSGGGLGGGSGTANVGIFTSIVWGNTASNGPQFHIYESGIVNAEETDIDTINQSGTNSLAVTSINNIFTNPLFLNSGMPAGIDACWMTNDDGYQLQASSLCIDNGVYSNVVPHDLAFNNRMIGNEFDMGAYESITSTTGINELSNKKPFYIFPNPVINEFMIVSDHPGDFALINSMGQVIVEIEVISGNVNISVQDLSPGIYYLVNKERIVQKLIKM